jgi:hypothetical protein
MCWQCRASPSRGRKVCSAVLSSSNPALEFALEHMPKFRDIWLFCGQRLCMGTEFRRQLAEKSSLLKNLHEPISIII